MDLSIKTTERDSYAPDQALSLSKEIPGNLSLLEVNLLDGNTAGYFTIDQNWRLTDLNEVAERIFFQGRQVLLGKVICEEIIPENSDLAIFLNLFANAMSLKKPFYFEMPTQPDRSWLEVHAYPTRDGLSVFFRDITQSKRVEEDLRLAEERFSRLLDEVGRLDQLGLIGKMAGSFSHEIRNPLTTVRGFLQLLSGNPDMAEYREYYQLMIEELDRANAIITECLSMARNNPLEVKPYNLNEIVERMLPLIQADALMTDNYIQLELQKVPDLLLNRCEIVQLLLNLVRNGIEAMTPGGIITIKTYMTGEDVILAVQDQGPGIPLEIMDKVGTLFFSTKEQGTGFGLSICQSIAQRHAARIDIETSGAGTTFFVQFKPTGKQGDGSFASNLGI